MKAEPVSSALLADGSSQGTMEVSGAAFLNLSPRLVRPTRPQLYPCSQTPVRASGDVSVDRQGPSRGERAQGGSKCPSSPPRSSGLRPRQLRESAVFGAYRPNSLYATRRFPGLQFMLQTNPQGPQVVWMLLCAPG